MTASVIVPTYNERENLEPLIRTITGLDLPNLSIVIVDDNSPDGTGQLADQWASQDQRVRVVHRPGKLGLGTAYIAGFCESLAHGDDLILTMDADFSHNPHYIPAIMEAAKDYDLVIGSRYVSGGGTRSWGLERRLLSSGANTFTRLMLGLTVHDCTSGFRCYHRRVLESLALDRIFSNGYSFLIEILYKCVSQGWRVGEVPIIFEDRQRGRSKISQWEIARALYTVLRLSKDRFLRRGQSS